MSRTPLLRSALIPASMAALTAALMFWGCDEQGSLPGGQTTDATTATDSQATTATTIEDTSTGTETTPDATATATETTVSEDTTVATDSATPTDTEPGDATGDDATGDTTAGDTTTGEDTTTTDTAIVLPTERPPVIATSTTGLDGWNMNPGAEATKCVVKRLDNEDVLWVSQIRAELARGSHHMIIYKSAETVERATPFNCDPFVETLAGETFPLMITQIRNETLTFPNGVAFKFEPNQMVRLEAHFLNYFQEEIAASGTVHFDGIAADKVVAEANMLFYGAPDIDIPKGQSVTTPWYFLDVMPGTRLFALTGHTHQYGTTVDITYSSSVSDPGEAIYPPEDEDYDWEEPPVSTFDPHLVFGQGGKSGLRYRCSWTNTSNSDVGFGESANAEMCFLWAYYYPSQGYRMCISPGGLFGGVFGDQICCGGTDESPLCDYVRNWAEGN